MLVGRLHDIPSGKMFTPSAPDYGTGSGVLTHQLGLEIPGLG